MQSQSYVISEDSDEQQSKVSNKDPGLPQPPHLHPSPRPDPSLALVKNLGTWFPYRPTDYLSRGETLLFPCALVTYMVVFLLFKCVCG